MEKHDDGHDEQDDIVETVPAKRSGLVGGIVGFVLAILIIGGAFLYLRPDGSNLSLAESMGQLRTDVRNAQQTEGRAQTQSTDMETSSTADAITSSEPITDEGVTWLAKPEPLANLHLLDAKSRFAEDDGTYSGAQSFDPESKIHYFKMGSDHGHDILYADIDAVDPGGGQIVVFVRDTNDTYRLLTKHSASDQWGLQPDERTDKTAPKQDDVVKDLPTLASNVTVDTTTVYKGLSYQKSLTVGGNLFTQTGPSDTFPYELSGSGENRTLGAKLAATPYGTLYYSYTDDDNSKGTFAADMPIELSSIYLQRPDFTLASYQLYPAFLADDNVPKITWNDGSATNTDTYRYDGGGGCGSASGLATARGDISKDIAPVGKTSGGDTVYGFTNVDHPIVKAYYDEYAPEGKVTTWDQVGNQQTNPAISQQDFLSKYHALFVYKDALGRTIIFSSNTYGPQAECGKPVIYLYPTETTAVDVTVGADIRISEPDYGDGWQVTAEPSGQLTLADGRRYRSLFWEGQGHGQYPLVDRGFVVARKDLEPTLREHLTQLGLNAQESADFLEFWLPKMPTTPYTRLTWFGTKQMDELAPLTVNPKPDTSIRIFLDFVGLAQPIDIAPQQLSAPARRGFTLVEWGGLLRH